jgi:uncharacterized membrane protein
VDPFYHLWFAVRYAHVAAAAILIGGALLVAVLSLLGDHDASISAAGAYEWIFWIVVGVSVVTGVSNLGLKGDGLLGPDTGWGRALTAKLAAVLILLPLSLARSSFVARSPGARPLQKERRALVIRGLHGATAVLLVVVLWFGLGLAHGRY